MPKPKFGIVCWEHFTKAAWQEVIAAEGKQLIGIADIKFAENRIENLWLKKTSAYLFTNYVDEGLLSIGGLRMVIVPTSGADFQKVSIGSTVTVVDQGELLASAVAEHALTLVLALLKKLPLALREQSTACWNQEQYFSAIRQLRGKNVAVLGCGRVGSGIALLCSAFGASVTGFDLYPANKPGFASVLHISEMPACAANADIVIAALPLNSETERLLGTKFFETSKPGAIFINIARGKLVDEAALLAALKSGRIGAAGLDVFSEEPLPKASPLWGMPNVIITPHIAGNINLFTRQIMANALRAVFADITSRGN